MNKKLKFALTTIWILFSRSYDAYCTNLLTPDLSKEANPLVTVVGISSWTILLIILGLLTIYVIYAYYISVFRPMNLLPTEKGYTFSNFVAYVYLGYKDNWASTLYKFPKDLKRANNYFGHLLSKGLVYAGVITTIMWLLINNSVYYKTIHNAPFIYSILIFGCIVIAYIWNKSLYRQYLAETREK
ncbi:MAG: hypothetical protein ACKN9X_00775 [Candidatus Methylopumilus sp.]